LPAGVGGIFLPFNQDVWQAADASDSWSRGLEYFSAPIPNSFHHRSSQSLKEEDHHDYA